MYERDHLLTETLETDGNLLGENAHVWQPFTKEALADWEDAYFVDATTDMHPDCLYLGTAGELLASEVANA